MNKIDKNSIAEAAGLTLSEGEEMTAETLEELSNGKGDDDDE